MPHEIRYHSFEEFEKAYEAFLNQLTFQELRWLNQMTSERIKLIHQVNTAGTLSKLRIGDKVKWNGADGIERQGVIIRINSKTASVRTKDDSGWWRVSPHLLTRIA